MQLIPWAFALALASAGSSMAAKMAMMGNDDQQFNQGESEVTW
jgi:hypothetical protein